MLTNASGGEVPRYDYLPFGTLWNAPALQTSLAFALMERDVDTGQDYAAARYFEARLGRFTSVDPGHVAGNLFDPQSWNGYAYAHNNPLRWVDPTGEGPQCPLTFCTGTTETPPPPPPRWRLPIPDLGLAHFFFDSTFHPWDMSNWWPSWVRTAAESGPGIGSSGSQQPKLPMSVCSGSARVLKGNAATIGRSGGFSGKTAGDILVTAVGAAIIPRQWTTSRATLRPYLSQISGKFPAVGASFQGVVEIVGGDKLPRGFAPGTNVQDALMARFPGKLILELPGASRDYGVMGVTLDVPSAVGCPAGTSRQ